VDQSPRYADNFLVDRVWQSAWNEGGKSMRRWRILACVGIAVVSLAAVAFAVWNRPDTSNPFERKDHPGQAIVATETSETPSDAQPSPAKESSEPAIPPPDPEPGDTLQFRLGDELVDGFPKTIQLIDGKRTYTLEFTGSFIRKTKLLFITIDLYVIGSYIEKPTTGTTDELLDGMLVDGIRRAYLLRMLKTVPGSAVAHAIDLEIDTFFTDVDMAKVGDEVDQFRKIFANGAKRDQIVYMAWLPGGRSYASFQDPDNVGMVTHDLPLARAIWRIWAGKHSGPERVGLVTHIATDADAQEKQ
jgi:hypothetical protein